MRTRKLICVFLAVLMFITVLPLHAMAAGNIVIKYPSGYTAEKITNPTRGEGEVDGLEAGGDRFNSYGWSMESLGDYIYIGTNRTILSILVYMTIESMGAYIVPGLSNEQIYDLFNTITHNHYPVIESVDEANPPEIIRINPETGETISLELPEGIKNSTLRDGAGFRSALKYGDRIYFGCEGNKTMYIVSVGEDSIVREEYSSGGDGQGGSLSLRASTVHNNEPYFGGTSTKIPSWQALSAEEQQGKRSLCVLKMTPGEGGNEATFTPVADYNDFYPYVDEVNPAAGELLGNNVWDIVSYNGYIYATIMETDGCVIFKGYEDTSSDSKNEYGWVWERVYEGKDDNAAYVMTPVVYKDKLYFGSLEDIAPMFISIIGVASYVSDVVNGNENTKKLSQVMAPLYTIMKTTPKMFVLDDNDNMIHIEAVSNMLKSTYNYYQWRFCENDGELYVTTFDTSILFEHVIDISLSTLLKTFLQVMAPELMDLKNNLTRVAMPERNTLLTATNCLLNLAKINELTDLQIDEALASIALLSSSGKNIDIPATLRTLLKTVDAEGIRMLMEMRSRLKTSAGGFDVFKTSDGESWSMILDDGCNDRFNYGGRTIINHKSQLYIATANPFFGSQLWRLTKTVKTPYVKPEKPEGGAPQAAEAIANTYTIALNPNRGELDNVVLTTSTDGTLENLPIPERENYSFAGWYNAPTGGSLVDTNTVFIADTTLYAMWKLIRPEYTLDTVSTLSDKAIAAINGTRHIIQVTASEGGRVSPEGIKIIVKGGRLTVTAFPNEGYSIASFIVDGEDKGNIFYYTFKNIKENHRVEVVFVK